MHRISFVIFLLGFIFNAMAQHDMAPRCPYTGKLENRMRELKEAPDITITTTDGITRNLYTTLDSGKTVFIDLFYTTCQYCQIYAPVIEEIYQNTGAGQEGIEFWGISNNLFDTNSVIDQYKLNYNVTNPCAGPWGGGTTAFSIIVKGQEFYGFPTYCVICPDRTMYFNPCYPPTTTCFDPYFDACGATYGLEEENETEITVVLIYPNPVSKELTAEIKVPDKGEFTLNLVNILGVEMYRFSGYASAGKISYIIPVSDFPAGLYFLSLRQNGRLIGGERVQIAH